MTAVDSANKYDNDEILDYTGSPHHCIATDRVAVNETKWQDDFQQSQLGPHAHCSPDPWAIRRHTQNITSRDHIYKVTGEGTSRQIDFSEATGSGEPLSLSQITAIKADSTTSDDQSTTSTSTSSVTAPVTKYSMG